MLLTGIRVLCTDLIAHWQKMDLTLLPAKNPGRICEQESLGRIHVPCLQCAQSLTMPYSYLLFIYRIKAESIQSCLAQLYGNGGHAAYAVGRRGKPTSKQAINRAEVLADAAAAAAENMPARLGVPIQEAENQQGLSP